MGRNPLQWRDNEHDGGSDHQPHHCLLNRLFWRRSKEKPKLRVTGLCVGNSPLLGEFPAQMASDAKNVSLWWRHHACSIFNGGLARTAINSLAPGKFEWNFRHAIFKQILAIDCWCISCEIALLWMSLDFTDGQSTLVQVMAWCRQATSHYLSQCGPRSLSPYGVTRPQY